MTATQRANELFCDIPNALVPPKARKYRDHMCRKHAACSEIILTAFAHYAQIEEGLTCDDQIYFASDDDRAEYARATA